MNTEFDQKIEPYESMNEEMRPPCHEELMAPLFNIVKDGKELDDGEFKMPIDLIREKYPESGESDLERIMEYLEEAEEFCTDVCCCFAECIDVPFVPSGEKYQRNVNRIVQVCQKRYPWMETEQIQELLNTVCWLSNR